MAVAGRNLANYYPVRADEAWIMSASYKLATQGVFGTDMFAGFYGAERHYFIALPGLHLLQAALFRLAGAGLFQARLPALFSGLLLIWLVGGLARRWYGDGVGLAASGLLLFWRSHLAASDPRLPLLAVSQNGRYDALALVWLAIFLLDELWRRPGRLTAVALGLALAAATLTQFFGLFTIFLAAAAWWRPKENRVQPSRLAVWTVTAFLLPVGLYGLYAAAHWPDFVGQASLKGARLQFGSPAFYLDNLLREPERWRWPGQPMLWSSPGRWQPRGDWLLILGGLPALLGGWLAIARPPGRAAGWLAWGSLALFSAGLALFDQTKAPLYAVLLLPGLCLGYALVGVRGWRWLVKSGRPWPARLAAGLLALVIVAVLMIESVRSYRWDYQAAAAATPYLEVGRQIAAFVPPGKALLGAERWWWALREYPYLALNNLWAQWEAAEEDRPGSVAFAGQVAASGAEFIVVNDNVRGDIAGHSAALQAQFYDFLSDCSVLLADWTDESYGRIEIYQVRQPCQPAGG